MNTGAAGNSILLLGESGVGKTHFGAQLLKRLMVRDGHLQMNGQATNLAPFEAALESLSEGKAARHTATATYVDSIWPVKDASGRRADLVWPDYGGEQIKTMIASRRVPSAWQERVRGASAWLLLIRLQQTRISDDIFSRPLSDLRGTSIENREIQISDQARLIELLQMLKYVGRTAALEPDKTQIGIMLTCWDELDFDKDPVTALKDRLPMFWEFVQSNWHNPTVMGLSALGRPLSPREQDSDYISHGPEHFGYIVDHDGSQSSDLTLPIKILLDDLWQQRAG